MSRRDDGGFTLIETLAAITVFAIMTLGLAPLLAASLRGASTSRSFTVGKNVAVQAMERVRGLPYFVSGPKKVDVLDIYFPDTAAPGYASAGPNLGVYTTSCTPAASSVACPANAVPPGHTVTFRAAFVKKVAGSDPEQYAVATSNLAGYSWATASKPPESLLRMVITVQWLANDELQTYDLTSLIGDRRFGGLKIDGSAVVDYAVQVLTAFKSPLDQESDLSVVGGSSQSRVESKLLTTADQDVSAASLMLTDRTIPATADAEFEGAGRVITAPPDQGPFSANASVQQLPHADLGNEVVAGVGNSSYSQLTTSVTSDLPIATGTGQLSSGAGLALLWADTQADTSPTSRLRLRDTGMIAWVRPDPGNIANTLEASTQAVTSPLSAQQVVATARAEVGSFLMLPTTYITDTTAETAVVEVRGLEAEASCKAAPATGPAGAGSASATWEATLRYWQDPSDGDGTNVVPGSYAEVTLGEQAGADELEAIQADPPMVYEDPTILDPAGSPADIYLFAPGPADHQHQIDDDLDPATPAENDDAIPGSTDPVVPHNHPAYLAEWAALSETDENQTEPQLTSAGVNGAVRITTTRTNPDFLQSVVNVNLASLSCRALEAR